MRQSEVIGLRKSAVDLQHGTVTLTDTKKGEPRVVYLNDEASVGAGTLVTAPDRA